MLAEYFRVVRETLIQPLLNASKRLIGITLISRQWNLCIRSAMFTGIKVTIRFICDG